MVVRPEGGVADGLAIGAPSPCPRFPSKFPESIAPDCEPVAIAESVRIPHQRQDFSTARILALLVNRPDDTPHLAGDSYPVFPSPTSLLRQVARHDGGALGRKMALERASANAQASGETA